MRCIAKVADARTTGSEGAAHVCPHGAVAYDDRILSYNRAGAAVSIWTLDGRQAIPFVCGERQRQLLATQRGESDLALVTGHMVSVRDVRGGNPRTHRRGGGVGG